MSSAASLSIDEAAARTLRDNPSLRAARWRIEEARGRLLSAGRLTNPEVEFDYSRIRGSREYASGVMLTQRFPLTARLPLERAVARAELTAAEAELADGARRLAGEARAAAIKLLALQEQQALRRQQLVNSRELATFTRGRLAQGEASQVDSLQTDLEARQLAAESRRLDLEAASLAGELRILAGLRPGEPISIAGSLAVRPNAPVGGDARRRGDLRAALAKLEAADRETDLARSGKWEDFSLGLGVQRGRTEDSPEGLKGETTFAFKVGIPLPVWNQGLGRVLQAEATRRRTALELTALRERAENEAATARREMQAAAQIVGAFDNDLLPSARQIEEQFRSAYSSGQSSLTEVLRARGKRFELEAQRLDALRDAQLARARLQSATGSDSVLPPLSHKRAR